MIQTEAEAGKRGNRSADQIPALSAQQTSVFDTFVASLGGQ